MGNEVAALFVDPSHHGRGFGRQLMDKAVEEKGDLKVEVFELNTIGRQFYARYGFVFKDKYLHEPSGQMCWQLIYERSTHG
jgi:putative acetyltransferase